VSQSGTGDLAKRITRLEQQDQQLTRALELLARHEAAPAVKAGRDWDAYAAVIASFIGILALAVAGYTAYVQRQQLRAQVWPHLELKYSNVDPSIYITNQGTGPARVTAMRVTVDGVPVGTWSDVKKAAGFTHGEGVVTSWLSKAVLSPGKDFTIVKPADDEQSRAKFKELLPGEKHSLEMTVCYCSVLDDCWTTGAGGERDDGQARPRDSCPITASERFAQ
jgi:hypothetical protein